MKTTLILVAVFSVSLGAKLPSDFKLCKGDKDLDKCLTEAIEDALPKVKNGIAELNAPPLEPLDIPSVTIGEGKGAVNVVQKYKNFQIFGIPNSKLPKLKTTLSSNGLNIEMEGFIPQAKFVADYDFNGRVLLLPIVGNGKCDVTLDDLKVNIKFTSEKFEKKGKTYLKVTEFDVELFPGKVTYNFENLFNGDARLGGEMNKILNENWKDVFEDVKSGYDKVVGTVLKDYCNKIFSKIPYDDIF